MAFDATVLCRALLNPTGVEFELLLRAAQGVPFRGFTTDVVGMEFIRNAYEGFGAGARFRSYDEGEIEEFLDTFASLFDVENVHASPLGRALTPNHALHDRPLGEVVYAMTGQTDASLLNDLERQPTVTPGPSLRHFDPLDLHLVLVAVRDGADVLCTSNTTDYSMGHIGRVRVATPSALAEEWGLRLTTGGSRVGPIDLMIGLSSTCPRTRPLSPVTRACG